MLMRARPSTLLRAEMLAAVCVIAFGVGVAILGSGYPMGTASRMGSGYFPVILGVALVMIGLALVAEAWQTRPGTDAVEPLPVLAALALCGGVLSFALLLRPAGLVPAIFALVMIATLGERPWKPVGALVIASGMSAISIALFILALRVPLRSFWW
jgi:hypothetical protein